MQLILLALDESYCVLDKKTQLIFEIRTLIECFESITRLLSRKLQRSPIPMLLIASFCIQDLSNTILQPA